MSDGKHGKNPLDQLQDELAAETGREAPEYNIIAMTAGGRMLGAVTLAPGLCSSLDDACDAVQGFFRSSIGAPGAVNVRPITQAEGAEAAARIRERIGKPQQAPPKADLGAILVDVKNANDCCVFTIGDYCKMLPSLKPESEVTCTSCGSYYRYTNDGEGNYAWVWMLPKKYVRSVREIYTLADAYDAARERLALRDREVKLAQTAQTEPPLIKFGEEFNTIGGSARVDLPLHTQYIRIHEGSQVADLLGEPDLHRLEVDYGPNGRPEGLPEYKKTIKDPGWVRESDTPLD